MAVDTTEDTVTDSAESPGAGREFSRRIFRAVLDVIELEVQIITLRLLVTLRDAMVRVCLAVAAVILALAGVVFLEIAIFRACEGLVPTIWVFLIFAIGHLLLAGGLVLLASRPMRTEVSNTPGKSDKPAAMGVAPR